MLDADFDVVTAYQMPVERRGNPSGLFETSVEMPSHETSVEETGIPSGLLETVVEMPALQTSVEETGNPSGLFETFVELIPVVYDLGGLLQYDDSAVFLVTASPSNAFEKAPTSDTSKDDTNPSIDASESICSKTSFVRKRPRCEQLWAKNRKKLMRSKGQEYVTHSGKVVPAKVFNKSTVRCCKRNCVLEIDEGERQDIHRNFWQLGSHSAQTTFIAGCIEQKSVATRKTLPDDHDSTIQTARKRSSFQKNFSRLYTLSTSERRVKVCKNLFLQTLGVSDGRVHRILLNQRQNGSVASVSGEKKKSAAASALR